MRTVSRLRLLCFTFYDYLCRAPDPAYYPVNRSCVRPIISIPKSGSTDSVTVSLGTQTHIRLWWTWAALPRRLASISQVGLRCCEYYLTFLFICQVFIRHLHDDFSSPSASKY